MSPYMNLKQYRKTLFGEWYKAPIFLGPSSTLAHYPQYLNVEEVEIFMEAFFNLHHLIPLKNLEVALAKKNISQVQDKCDLTSLEITQYEVLLTLTLNLLLYKFLKK